MSPRSLVRAVLIASVCAASLLITTAPAHAETFGSGNQGPAVACWQKKLRWVAWAQPAKRVPLVTVDGRFGPQTTAATKAFQRASRIVVDGIVGPQTHAAMSAQLRSAAHTLRDEYASALHYGTCTLAEPMVCRPAPGYPLVRDNPHVSDPRHLQFYATTWCSRLDRGLERQDATLHLEEGTDDRPLGLVRLSGVRQTALHLGKGLVVQRGRMYQAMSSVTLTGSVMYLSAPGCRRTQPRVIVCQHASAGFTVR